MRKHANVKPEIIWSVFRRQWTPGFEDILDHGLNNGLYDPDNPLEKCAYYTNSNESLTDLLITSRLVFLWIFVPWIQREVDVWVSLFNRTSRRADKNKLLPHGIPDLITAKPHRYNILDFKVSTTFTLS